MYIVCKYMYTYTKNDKPLIYSIVFRIVIYFNYKKEKNSSSCVPLQVIKIMNLNQGWLVY